MLGKIVLILVQLGGGWAIGHWLAGYVAVGDAYLQLVIYVLVFSVAVWLIGLIGGEVIKGVDKPKPSALGWAVAISAIFTGLSFIPQLVGILPFQTIYLPLIGAVVGYHVSR